MGLHRKPTFTGLGLEFNSAITDPYKCSLIYCLVDRAYKFCCDHLVFSLELNFLTKFFSQNGFPIFVIENCFRSKLDNIFSYKPQVTTR